MTGRASRRSGPGRRTIVLLTALIAVLLLAGCAGGTPTAPPADPGQPLVDCQGVPARTCQEIVNDARTNAAPGSFPIRIRAVCTKPPCTPQQGDVSVDIQYSNGRTDSYGMGWSGPMPGDVPVQPEPAGEPSLPVEPICVGVPATPCADMALGMVGSDPQGRAIESITVRCTVPPCTEATGEW